MPLNRQQIVPKFPSRRINFTSPYLLISVGGGKGNTNSAATWKTSFDSAMISESWSSSFPMVNCLLHGMLDRFDNIISINTVEIGKQTALNRRHCHFHDNLE